MLTSTIFVLAPAEVFCAKLHALGIVTANNLNFRPQPGLNNTPLKKLNKGTKVRVLKHLNEWLKITHDGQIGYIRNHKRYVRLLFVKTKPEKQTTASNSSDMEEFRKEAEIINREIKKGKAKVLKFTKKEASIVNSLNHIDLAVNKARKRVSTAKYELISLQKKITETINAFKDLTKQININEDYAYTRLVAFYKLNWLGRINVIASAESTYDFFNRKKALERILAYDENIWQNLINNKAELQELLSRLNIQKMAKLSLETELKQQIKILSREKAKRSKLLKDIRNKKSLELAAIESFKLSAIELDKTIKSLSSRSDPPTQVKNMLTKHFVDLKGLLDMPVKGKIISFFGPYKNIRFNVVNFRSGIKIKADRGEPIRAVCGGRILYAKWFKGYGNMIIINHGDNYYTLYAHAEELFASKGDVVEMGEVVATVGDSGSMIGPNLHFEVRHHGKPLNPLKWVKKG
jgi:septal ring factor EnvC (AmiA/AmiB activator)